MRTKAKRNAPVKILKDIDLEKEEKIDAFFSGQAQLAKIFLDRNPIPAELLKRNSPRKIQH